MDKLTLSEKYFPIQAKQHTFLRNQNTHALFKEFYNKTFSYRLLMKCKKSIRKHCTTTPDEFLSKIFVVQSASFTILFL